MSPKKTTISEIAIKLKITPSTVSRALNNNSRISEEMISKVKKMALKMNYEPNLLASALRSGKTKTIGVIVPVINRNIFASVIRGVEELANSFDYKVVICQTYDDYANELKTVDTLLAARVDGIIASVAKNSENFDHFQKIIDRNVPLVLFDRTTPQINTSQVVIDDYYASYTITKALINKGCKRIGFLSKSKKITIYKDRLRGYTDALVDSNMAIDKKLIIESNLQLEDGRAAMEQLLKLAERPDAVFSCSDYGAMGAMQVIKEHQLSIPNDIALAGFGNEPFAEFSEPALTTVNQMSVEMGLKAAGLFFEMLQNGNNTFVAQKIVLKPEVIFRASTLVNHIL